MPHSFFTRSYWTIQRDFIKQAKKRTYICNSRRRYKEALHESRFQFKFMHILYLSTFFLLLFFKYLHLSLLQASTWKSLKGLCSKIITDENLFVTKKRFDQGATFKQHYNTPVLVVIIMITKYNNE